MNFIAFLYTNIFFALKERGIFFCISCLTAQFSAYDFRQPLISGEARASPVSPVPTPLVKLFYGMLFTYRNILLYKFSRLGPKHWNQRNSIFVPQEQANLQIIAYSKYLSRAYFPIHFFFLHSYILKKIQIPSSNWFINTKSIAIFPHHFCHINIFLNNFEFRCLSFRYTSI